jgi:hypothetical protein
MSNDKKPPAKPVIKSGVSGVRTNSQPDVRPFMNRQPSTPKPPPKPPKK